jgi:hypothetical protein
MTWPQLLASEFRLTLANPETWIAIALALVLGAACWFLGASVARWVGLLDADAPTVENLAVGLATGLILVTSFWAAARSGGRSSFTPVAAGFVVSFGLTLARRRRRGAAERETEPAPESERDNERRHLGRRRAYARTAACAGLFVVIVGLLYGATIAPAARDGVQPIIERDTAYYAILGRDLATTGTETNLGPSGFAGVPGLPGQIWYHWGEAWLASAVISFFGLGPMAARHLIVLPLVLLATAALGGTLVRKLGRTRTHRAFLTGFSAMLVLGPIATAEMTAMSSWAVGLLAGIAIYGMGAASALLAMVCLAVLGSRQPSWGLATFLGTAVAFILPAHIAIAILGVVGFIAGAGFWVFVSLRTRRSLPRLTAVQQRTLLATVVLTGLTVGYGMLTGHGLGGSGAAPAVIEPFSSGWRETVVRLAGGAGIFLAIPLALWRSRRTRDPAAGFYLGAIALLVAGAIGWGARLSEFTMFYLLFAGIAVFGSAITAVALWVVVNDLLRTGHRPVGLLIAALAIIQLTIGTMGTTLRVEALGVAQYESIPSPIVRSIAALPADAKLAYSCGPMDEISFGVPQLVTIDAVTARRVIPMCFEREYPSIILGAPRDIMVPSQFFRGAPQAELYPTATAVPSPAQVRAFLAKYDIQYIYADAVHPNTLVPNAEPVAASGDAQVLRVP